jgi:hypothetical protein
MRAISEYILASWRRSWAMLHWILMVIGVIFMLLPFVFAAEQRNFLASSVQVDAQVVGMEVDEREGKPIYRPIFEVRTGDQSARHNGDGWVSPKPHEVGERVTGFLHNTRSTIRTEKMMAVFESIGQVFRTVGLFLSGAGMALFAIRRGRKAA